jgi:predicted P-loop ATPase
VILTIATAPKRNSLHWKNGTIEWSEIVGWLDSPAAKKEAGNYLLGVLGESTRVHKKGDPPCTDIHRLKNAVVTRSAITLDIDSPNPDFVDAVEMLFDHAAIIHTTHSSSPDAPRYRMIVPTDRSMKPDEYITAAETLMRTFGKDQFDPGSTQPERYMFKPAAQEPGWFQSWVLPGDPVPVDTLLADFVEDLSTKPLPKPGKNKRDPFTLDGIMGAFNRAYAGDWDSLIEAFDLPYQKIAEDRYHLVGATAAAGMGPVQGAEGFVYSHHANDPAYGTTCSAWDLVRLHHFGEMDEDVNSQTPPHKRPSHAAMAELATRDNRAMAEMVGLDFAEAFDDEGNANDWRLNLRRNNRGVITNVVQNRDLIRDNDPALRGLYLNEMSLVIEAEGDLPWRVVSDKSRTVDGIDKAEFMEYLEREYGLVVAKETAGMMVDIAGARRRRHPTREYLESLKWDGESRIETALPGVKHTAYTRMVSRKVLVAAAARVLEPGVKWDHTLVLFGSEGLGKSWWIERMAKGWSASLGRIGDKDTLLTMQAAWIITADEGHSLKKADHDAQKEFLTRTHDMYRAPYEKETRRHPRHCVIWSTTNDEIFLRRQEGNRRFLIVRCDDKVDFDLMTDEYVDQVWAEAVHLYQSGERLFLDGLEALEAAEQRERFVEEDHLLGVIESYLETPVKEGWMSMTPEERTAWLRGRQEGFEAPGTERIDLVCSTQIWVEALGRRLGDKSHIELREIYETIKRIPGWEPAPTTRHAGPIYGTQRVFIRKGTDQ